MSLSSQNGGLASQNISFHDGLPGIARSADEPMEIEAGTRQGRPAWGIGLPGQES